MSNKEVVLMLLEKVPDYKMGYVLAYTQGLTQMKKTTTYFATE